MQVKVLKKYYHLKISWSLKDLKTSDYINSTCFSKRLFFNNIASQHSL